jgi:hypothetical protein
MLHRRFKLYVGTTRTTTVTALLELQPVERMYILLQHDQNYSPLDCLAPSAMFLSQIGVRREAYLELSCQITASQHGEATVML